MRHTPVSFCEKHEINGGKGGGTVGTYRPPSYFFLEKNCPQAKKYNINKICQIKPRFKKMTCLMTIAETKNTSSAFRFFHKNY